MSVHFVDIRLLVVRAKHTVTPGKIKRDILRQFQVEVPVDRVEDAEDLVERLATKFRDLFEELGREAKRDYQSIGPETIEEDSAGGDRQGILGPSRLPNSEDQAAPK
jgi:hypothetical protein